MIYYAHTTKNADENGWHLLSSHLMGTSELTSSFACSNEYKGIFKMAGCLHDLGKYQHAFQKYLKEGGRRGSVPHASWGAAYSLKLKNQEIAFVIDGHHKGLPDKADAQNDLKPYSYGDVPDFENIIETFHDDMKITANKLNVVMPAFSSQIEREFFIRYLFSSLTDADWLDTERACNPDLSGKREHRELNHELLIYKLEKEINSKPKNGEINKLRNEVREFALSKTHMPIGFYSMNLPTGMGKTLASVSWALSHANHHGLKRIIIVLPFINIIDQTAQTLKNIIGDEFILEHHSGVSDDFNITENLYDNQYGKRLACENWDYPIIITTTVQFFESLFSNKPSKCRKIHNIAESVVIFDEVQSLPKEIIIPTLTMLKNINSVMKTSFLFCTATLPAFETRDAFDGIDSLTPLVENTEEIFNKTRRVEYSAIQDFEPVDFDALLSTAVDQNCSVLAVFNTKRAAREFFNKALVIDRWEKRYHLSTGMCPIHRKEVITDIRKDLQVKKKVFVSSTQLIEAGVDFDFPCVFREIAPLESIIQSAGRCNREGLMSGYGKVFLFRLKDAGMPDRQYKTAAGFALDLIMDNPEKLHDHSFYPDYYKKMMNLFIDGDARKINSARENFNFRTVNDIYRIIAKATKGLFIYAFNAESEKLIKTIRGREFLSKDDYRKMQLYMVQVYESFLINNIDKIEETSHGVMVWHGGYDASYGISVEPLHSDNYVV